MAMRLCVPVVGDLMWNIDHDRTARRMPIATCKNNVPMIVVDDAFPKHSDGTETQTLLVIRVYPFKLFFCCGVPSKGRHPGVVRRLERFIRKCGLAHFTCRSAR